jgi:DNA-binding transcriptional LysR family regulator
MNVTIAYLRAFLEVGRALNFSRAAEKLSLTQPSLSMAIQQLEKALKVKLLDRTTRKIHLTDEGATFLVTVERLLDEFDTAIESMRTIAERRGGRVSIATLPSMTTTFIPTAVASFSSKYPGIRVHLRDDNTPNVWARVQRGDVDFGMAGDFKPLPELEFVPLLCDKFGVVMREDHPLARINGSEKAITYMSDTMGAVTVSGGKSSPTGAAAATASVATKV